MTYDKLTVTAARINENATLNETLEAAPICGFGVGVAVGRAEGTSEGEEVGIIDGDCVVGDSVGTADGEVVGVVVGW